MWHYLYFIVHLRTKSQTEYTGPESFVSTLIQQNDLKWFPRHQAMSLQLLPTNDDQHDVKVLFQVKNCPVMILKYVSSGLKALQIQFLA